MVTSTVNKGGKKKTLSQGAYEFGCGYFDIKFDGQIGVRTSLPINHKKRIINSGVNKSNHFWWLISKVYLNKFLLEDSKNSLQTFFDKAKKDKENYLSADNGQPKPAIEPLLDESCLDFEKLVKNDPELEGLNAEDLQEKAHFQPNPLLDDNLWNDDKIEKEKGPQKDEIKFYAKKLENASETDIKNILHIIDDRFQIENDESLIGIY